MIFKKINTQCLKPIFPLLVFLTGFHTLAQSGGAFPFKWSFNKRILEDQNSQSFLIKEFAAWGLIQALPGKEENAFLDSIREKGFNTIITSVLSNAPSQMTGNPPYWQGISPLNIQWDFSTPNEKYFEHVDRFFKMAEQKEFLLWHYLFTWVTGATDRRVGGMN